jgi:hypothetical protein
MPLYGPIYNAVLCGQSKINGKLLGDISALADRYYRADPFRPHFMGAVVLEQLNTATGTLDLRQIIDGQQRLTTLQIVIEAACDVCESFGSVAVNHARDLRRLTRNDPRDEIG